MTGRSPTVARQLVGTRTTVTTRGFLQHPVKPLVNNERIATSSKEVLEIGDFIAEALKLVLGSGLVGLEFPAGLVSFLLGGVEVAGQP